MHAHNHFCVMPEVDPCFASRHPANPAGNVITIIHSSPLGLLVHIHTYCEKRCVSHQELENFQRQFFECCIIVSALSSGFVYLLRGDAVTTAQNINDSLK